MDIHPVSLEYLREIDGNLHGYFPDQLPVAVEHDLTDMGLIERYGRGRNRKIGLTKAGREFLTKVQEHRTVTITLTASVPNFIDLRAFHLAAQRMTEVFRGFVSVALSELGHEPPLRAGVARIEADVKIKPE